MADFIQKERPIGHEVDDGWYCVILDIVPTRGPDEAGVAVFIVPWSCRPDIEASNLVPVSG